MRSEFQTSSTIANARAALQDQTVVVHGGGFTVEEQELDRRQLLSNQLKLARQLRGVMERAAETAKTLSPSNARDFYLELEPEICQLVSLTKAVRGEYTLDHYHQYDLDTTTTTATTTTTTNSSNNNNNYNPPFHTTTMNGHSPRNNNNNNDKLMSAIHVIKEQLKDMAYERNPSLFPERKIRRKQITTKKITPTTTNTNTNTTTTTNVGNNNNGLSSKKKKNRTFKPSQTCLQDTTDVNDDANDADADDNMVHPTSISIHHNGKEKEKKTHPTNITTSSSTNTNNNSSEQRNSKRVTKERKDDSNNPKVSTPNNNNNNNNSLPTNPGDTPGYDTPKSSKSHRSNRRKNLNKKFDKTLTKKDDTTTTNTNNHSPSSSRNFQQRKSTESTKTKETKLQSTPTSTTITTTANTSNNNNNGSSGNTRRKLSHKRSNPPHSSKVSSEKPSSPSLSLITINKKNVMETPSSIISQKSATSVVKIEKKNDSLPSTPFMESENNNNSTTSTSRKKKVISSSSPASSSESSSTTKRRKIGNNNTSSSTSTSSSTKKMRKTQNQIRKCHQCKVNGTEYRLCHFWFMNGTKCRKTYCKNCLIDIYGLTQDFNTILSDSEWHCPSCLGTCTCPVCVKHRQRAEIKQAKRPARASAGFYSFT